MIRYIIEQGNIRGCNFVDFPVQYAWCAVLYAAAQNRKRIVTFPSLIDRTNGVLIVKHPNAMKKRALLAGLLLLACLALSACYMEPDRIVDNNNGLNVGDGGQGLTPSSRPRPR